MNILERIIADKKNEVAQKKLMLPVEMLEQLPYFDRECNSLVGELLMPESTGIIAEYKRRSPSKGVINDRVEVEEVVSAYDTYGAAGISILTDEKYFGGTNEDIMMARDLVLVPILRKDFMIDEYQIIEAKAIGADVILLIAACLSPLEVKRMAAFAQSMGLEVLLEVHNGEELGHICDDVDLVGVNNRDLKTFTVDVNRSVTLSAQIPVDKIRISESGISDVNVISYLRSYGYKGFLIGENFMKEEDPGASFEQFVKKL